MITGLLLLVALGLLTWGYLRAKPYGTLGLLAWLQSVVLMAPWLLFFGLFAVGIYLNFVSVLFIFLLSTGLYIFLGSQLRAIAQRDNLGSRLERSQTPPSREHSDAPPAQNEAECQSSPLSGQHSASPEPRPQAVDTRSNQADSQIELKPGFVSVPDEDLKAIQSIFGIDTFFATESIPYQDGVVFRGNLRGDPETVYPRLNHSLTERMGDRYRLFLVENQEGKPVVIVLPSTNDPPVSTPFQRLFAIVLAIATLGTCLETAGLLMGFDFFSQPDRLTDALPIALGVLLTLGIHEVGHLWQARKHQVKLSPPFLIPTWQIGAFGALTRIESLLANRQALFDIAFAGPALGGGLSLMMLIGGLLLSNDASLFQLPSQFFQSSVLIGTLAKATLGDALTKQIVAVHPLTIVGWLGLLITALNLMPAGRLDGGRIMQAIYGRKVAGRATFITLIVLGIAALVNPLAIYWAIVILVLQRNLERPCLNELTEPDDTRAALALVALFLTIATLLPLTPSLAGRLGIGG